MRHVNGDGRDVNEAAVYVYLGEQELPFWVPSTQTSRPSFPVGGSQRRALVPELRRQDAALVRDLFASDSAKL